MPGRGPVKSTHLTNFILFLISVDKLKCPIMIIWPSKFAPIIYSSIRKRFHRIFTRYLLNRSVVRRCLSVRRVRRNKNIRWRPWLARIRLDLASSNRPLLWLSNIRNPVTRRSPNSIRNHSCSNIRRTLPSQSSRPTLLEDRGLLAVFIRPSPEMSNPLRIRSTIHACIDRLLRYVSAPTSEVPNICFSKHCNGNKSSLIKM